MLVILLDYLCFLKLLYILLSMCDFGSSGELGLSLVSLYSCLSFAWLLLLIFILKGKLIMSYFFSFSFLLGPWNHMKLLTSKERLPFTFIYLLTLSGEAQHNSYWSSLKMIQSSAWAYAHFKDCSYHLLFITGTLYFALALQSTVLTCIAAVAQVDIIFVGDFSNVWLPMPESQQSWVRSQYPPTQWNLRRSRWSST